jgi:hypothetical protein
MNALREIFACARDGWCGAETCARSKDDGFDFEPPWQRNFSRVPRFVCVTPRTGDELSCVSNPMGDNVEESLIGVGLLKDDRKLFNEFLELEQPLHSQGSGRHYHATPPPVYSAKQILDSLDVRDSCVFSVATEPSPESKVPLLSSPTDNNGFGGLRPSTSKNSLQYSSVDEFGECDSTHRYRFNSHSPSISTIPVHEDGSSYASNEGMLFKQGASVLSRRLKPKAYTKSTSQGTYSTALSSEQSI